MSLAVRPEHGRPVADREPVRPRPPVRPPRPVPPRQRAQPRRRRRLQHRAGRRLLVAAVWTVVAVLVGLSCFVAGLLSAPIDLAQPPPPKPAELLASDGQLLATVRSPETREPVAGNDIAPVMRAAIVAAEDERFFDHDGVDPLALVRAVVNDVGGANTQGGSTLTQQYVKNVYTGNQRTLLRKVREAALALRLEQRLSKQEILTRYLNTLYLGNGNYGVQAAARFYFGVSAHDLDLPEAAMLAGLAPAPSLYNPLHDMAAAKARQLYTLNRMVAGGEVTSQQASAAYAAPLRIVGRSEQALAADTGLQRLAPEFADMVTAQVREQLRASYGAEADDVLYRGGLRVTTTLDPSLQQAVVQAVHDVLPAATDPSAAVVAIDPRTGNLLALTTKRAGGYQRGGYNVATQATRSSGSTIKPFTLAAALERGHTLDEEHYGPHCVSIPNPGGTPNPYRPCNAGDSESGTFTLRSALAESVNTIYAPLAHDVGLAAVMKVAGDAGLAPRANLRTNPAAALGVEVTPISMARAYATLVDHGVRHDVRTVLSVRASAPGGTGGDRVLSAQSVDPPGDQVMPADVADRVSEALRDVVDFGTGTQARQDFPVYGKTGTTDDEVNAWFVGCTRELCLATWMGYEQQYLDGAPHGMHGVEGVRDVYGGTLPAKIFAQTMRNYRVLRGQPAAR